MSGFTDKVETSATEVKCPRCKRWHDPVGMTLLISGVMGSPKLTDLNSGGLALCSGCFKEFVKITHAWIEGRIRRLGN